MFRLKLPRAAQVMPGPQLSPEQKALAFLMRNPPKCTNMKPQGCKDIAKALKKPGKPAPKVCTVCTAVRRFHFDKQQVGRKKGWRKTTPAEDKAILAAFKRVRKPLGCEVDHRDVWNALSDSFRSRRQHRQIGRPLA